MKKYLVYLIMGLVFVPAGWALTNGDFETMDLSPWSTYGTGLASVQIYASPHTGDCNAYLQCTFSQYVEIYQAESAAAIGETWKVEGWAYHSGGSSYFGWYDGPQVQVTAGSWTKYTDTRTFIPGDYKEVSFDLDGFGFAYLDDVVTSKVITALNTNGSFDSAGDLSYWMFETYGGASSKGFLNWVSDYVGHSCAQMSQNAGEKAQLTQLFSVPSSGWYTASARVATDISDPTKQQKVYLYLQELSASTAVVATGNVIIQPGKGGFSGAGIWQELKISFYSNATFMGVQVVGINQSVTSTSGNFYIDDVWVVAGASLPSGMVTLTNPDFTSDTSGWLAQIYGGASGSGTWSWDGSNVGGHIGVLSGYQAAGEKGQLTQDVNLPYGSDDALCSVWVYSGAGSMGDTQKVYLYLFSLNSSAGTIVVSGNAILQPGGWAQGVWRELKFGYPPLTGYNSVQLVGINRPAKPTQYIYFDTVSLKQD